MKKMKEWVSLVIFVLGCVFQSQGWHDPTKSNNNNNTNPNPRATKANCAPATARTQLELNNIRALIETGGSMWQDRSTGSAAYEVPKGSGHTAIYSGSLWMGGKDFNGQLKIAAVMFRQGNDFWTGPLTTDGTVEVCIPANPNTLDLLVTEDNANYINSEDFIRLRTEQGDVQIYTITVTYDYPDGTQVANQIFIQQQP